MVVLDRRGTIAVLKISNPPVNAVSEDLANALSFAIREAIVDPAVQAIVLQGEGGLFIAGADIKMLRAVANGEAQLPDLNGFLFEIEKSPKPVVAALQGAVLGGGLETAMAAHYRVAAVDASFGQPEVQLGLIPGMGGTQRLPRLVGFEKALEMCVFGEPIGSAEAKACGLVDQISGANVLEAAIQLAVSVSGKPRPASERPSPEAAVSFPDWRALAQRKRRGEQAPLAVVDALEAAASLSFPEGFAREQRIFRDRLGSSQARAMLHLFFAERAAGKIPGLRAETQPKPVTQAAVLGAGFMGTGIAMAFANAGIPVRLSDVSGDALARSAATIRKRCRNTSLIDLRSGYEGFERADVVVEAVVESLPAKQEAFTQIARVAAEGSVLATNTSTLDVDEIASVTGRPEMVAGLHFFSPAQVMRLLEVVRAARTSDAVIATAVSLAKRLGKVAVVSRNQFGFIGNRMVMPYLGEAHKLVEEGVGVQQINRALYEFGMRMGPLAMEDLVGLDVTFHMRQEALRRGRLDGPLPRMPDLLYRSGRFGQKTGIGWSVYDEQRNSTPNPEIASLTGGSQREITDSDIVQRCLGALVAEGRKVVAEGVAVRASDVDVVYVHGYGFPAWRGGPLYWAERNPC